MEHLISLQSREFDESNWREWLPIHDRWIIEACDTHGVGSVVDDYFTVQSPAGLEIGRTEGMFFFACPRCDAEWTHIVA